MGYEYLVTVHDESQASFIESLLKSRGIRYELMNRQASGPVFGMGLRHLTFYVHPADVNSAARLLEDVEKDDGRPKSRFTRKKASRRHKKNKHRYNEEKPESAAPGESFAYAVLIILALVFILGLVFSC